MKYPRVPHGYFNRRQCADHSKQRAVVPFFQPHHLLFDGLNILRQLEERFDNLSFGRLISERREQRMNRSDASGNLIASGADLGDGGGTVHGWEVDAADGLVE